MSVRMSVLSDTQTVPLHILLYHYLFVGKPFTQCRRCTDCRTTLRSCFTSISLWQAVSSLPDCHCSRISVSRPSFSVLKS